jgi:SpoVK/Ycf46/Vps4 family AAA+-type ATPase
LDCERTPSSRGKALLDLFPGSPLHKKGIISEIGDSEVRLAVPIRDELRRLVCGAKPLTDEEKDKIQRNSDCDVGNICDPEYSMDDVVLSPGVKDEILLHLNTHSRLLDLGVVEKVRRGRGLGMLLYGQPGTGKSMLSHAIARHLGKKVLQAGLDQIKSKWVGDTEKNISNLFKTAKENDCVLCFDEADSMLCSRNDAIRSWEISVVNMFLEEIERFNGVFIMTTNLEGRLDEALERRVALRIRLEAPDASVREQIWRKQVPSKVNCSDDINWPNLANKYSFTGGYIKNAVLSGLRHMLSRNVDRLSMDDLIFGAECELRGFLKNQARGPMGFVSV